MKNEIQKVRKRGKKYSGRRRKRKEPGGRSRNSQAEEKQMKGLKRKNRIENGCR